MSNGHGLFAHKDKGGKAVEVDKAKAAREWAKAQARIDARRAANAKRK